MNRIMRWVVLAWLAFASTALYAHEMTLAEMELRESAPGEFLWQWTASGNFPASDELAVIWPLDCIAETNILRCGTSGLSGELAVHGIGKRYSAAMIKVFWLDGQTRVYTLTSSHPSVQLYGSADDKRGMSEIAGTYTVLGIEHILSGFDHLLFVIALLFLVGFNRRLLLTITAFTAAHSLTLALSALELITLRSPPVEATIALSIVLIAAEALSDHRTLTRRWPALVAFLFGLLHGLGFAGALRDIGLPQQHLSIALLTFNVGVELGQLSVVGLAYALHRALSKYPRFALARTPALYGIGGIAAYWTTERIVALVT